MLFDPEDGMTWEQICDRAYTHMNPELQARVLAYCEENGISRNDYLAELLARSHEKMNDPAIGPQYRADFERWLDRERFPYGHDPLVRG